MDFKVGDTVTVTGKVTDIHADGSLTVHIKAPQGTGALVYVDGRYVGRPEPDQEAASRGFES